MAANSPVLRVGTVAPPSAERVHHWRCLIGVSSVPFIHGWNCDSVFADAQEGAGPLNQNAPIVRCAVSVYRRERTPAESSRTPPRPEASQDGTAYEQCAAEDRERQMIAVGRYDFGNSRATTWYDDAVQVKVGMQPREGGGEEHCNCQPKCLEAAKRQAGGGNDLQQG